MNCQQFLAYTNQSQQVQLSIVPITTKQLTITTTSTTSSISTSTLTSTTIESSQSTTQINVTIQSISINTLSQESDSLKVNLLDFSNETQATTTPVQSSKQIKHSTNSSSLVLPKSIDLTNYATSINKILNLKISIKFFKICFYF